MFYYNLKCYWVNECFLPLLLISETLRGGYSGVDFKIAVEAAARDNVCLIGRIRYRRYW